MRKKYFFILVSIVIFVNIISFIYGQSTGFEVSPFLIKSVLERGESISHKVTITNFEESQTFDIIPNADFISVDIEELNLNKDEEGSFNVVLDSMNFREDIYVGKITVSGENKEIDLPIILEIQTAFSLADVSIEVPQGFSGVVPGGDFVVDINAHKLKGQVDDFVLEYFVRNLDGKVIFFDQQDLRVGKQTSITKTIPIPEDALGDYVFSVSIKDKTGVSTGTSSFPFLVSESPELKTKSNYYLFISFGIIMVLIIAFLIFNHFWNKRIITTARE